MHAKHKAYGAKKIFSERAKHFDAVIKYIDKNADHIAKIISQSTGKTLVDALVAEVIPCAMATKWYRDNAEKHLKAKPLKTSSILFMNKGSSLHRLPLGVVGIISPWNYPLQFHWRGDYGFNGW